MTSGNYWHEREQINADVTPERPTSEIMDRLIALIPLCPENQLTPRGKFPKTFFHSLYGSERLREMCYIYALKYEGTFEFMLSMKAAAALNGNLTPNQAAAVLNTMIREYQQGRLVASYRRKNMGRP